MSRSILKKFLITGGVGNMNSHDQNDFEQLPSGAQAQVPPQDDIRAVPGNPLTGDSLAEDSLAEDSLAEDSLQGDSHHDNLLAENSLPEDDPVSETADDIPETAAYAQEPATAQPGLQPNARPKEKSFLTKKMAVIMLGAVIVTSSLLGFGGGLLADNLQLAGSSKGVAVMY
jgi:hypothetical protein